LGLTHATPVCVIMWIRTATNVWGMKSHAMERMTKYTRGTIIFLPSFTLYDVHSLITYTYISLAHYNLLILILSICMYVTLSYVSCHISLLKISKNSRSMTHHLMPRHLCPLKNNLKISRKSPMPCHLFPLKNNSKNSSSLPHHLYLLKNNSKNSIKSPHATSSFSI
jgi:hypothetical protein